MNVMLRVTGYDKQTESLAVEHDVPPDVASEARKLAQVGDDDDGLGAYPLAPRAAIALGVRLERPLNPDHYDWFLEPR